MKQFIAALLCLLLVLTAAGCSFVPESSISADLSASRAPEEDSGASDTPCDIVFEELASGGGIAEQFLEQTEDSGIMREVLATLGYEVTGQEELENGAVRYTLEITAIDMEALLEDLPGNISSKEEALEEMLQMVEAVGLDYKEFVSLYGENHIADGLLYAKDLKDRYSVLWLYYEFFR